MNKTRRLKRFLIFLMILGLVPIANAQSLTGVGGFDTVILIFLGLAIFLGIRKMLK